MRPGIRTKRKFALSAILVGVGLQPDLAVAQAQLQSGWFVTPALTAVAIYDDNLFFSPAQPQDDRILRLSPVIETGYRSDPLTLSGRYTRDAERYARHTELDSNQTRELASLDFRYLPTRLLTLAADASYIKTQTPGELNLESGVERARIGAERVSVSPAAAYRFDRLTVGTMTYTIARDRLTGGITTDTHTLASGVDRRLTRQDVVNVGYTWRRFIFDGEESITSHSLIGGGTHEFTPRTSASLSGGPRYADGSTEPEISASLRYALDRGDVALTYTRSPTTVVGQAGVVTTQSLGVVFSYRPEPSTEIRVTPTIFSSTRGDLGSKVYRMILDASYRLTRYVSLFGSYQFSSQHGSLEVADDVGISRNLYLLGVVIAEPTREGSVLPTRPRAPSAWGAGSETRRTELRPEEE
jgi:hypothetical protein